LRPVGVFGPLRAIVHGRDRGLDSVLAERRLAQRGVQDRRALGDLRSIPERPVLLGERDELPVGRRSRRAPRVDQQHQREEARDLAVVGQQPVRNPRHPDRLVGELGAVQLGAGGARVALVEDQVQHMEHEAHASRPLLATRQPERLTGRLDAPFGP
jgi:hypothetical protein